MSFLVNCPRCGTYIARDTVCLNCGYAPESAGTDEGDRHFIAEYQRRRRRCVRNYTICIMLIVELGAAAVVFANSWKRIYFRDSTTSFAITAALALLTLVLGLTLVFANRLFPRELLCPSCNTRLGELGLQCGHCPRCSVRLK